MTMNRVLRSVVLVISLAVFAVLLSESNAAAQSGQDATEQVGSSYVVQLKVEPADQTAVTSASAARYHLFLANTPGAKGVAADFPPLKFPVPHVLESESLSADSESNVAGSVLSPPQPAFYPADVTRVVSTGKTILSAKSHPIFINCSPPGGTCWGNPTTFLMNLGASTFIHLVDQYVGSTTANRYTVGTSFTASVTIFAGTSGVPTLSENDILGLVHSAAKNTLGGTGYGHIYHVFIPQGVDTCMDEGPCYSPDNPATSAFCAYHFAVHFSDIGNVYYTVEPFQNVTGCAVPQPSPNGALIDSTASTLSHELFESITDPDIHTGFRALNSGAVFGSEIGDLCGGIIFGIFPINAKSYEIQLEYSNFYHACASTP